LYPSPSQRRRLQFMLHQTRHLYNALLDQRRYSWTSRRESISNKTQYAELTVLRQGDPGIASVYRECQDAVLHRLDLGMQAFFRRIKRGETPGYPRFKPSSRPGYLSSALDAVTVKDALGRPLNRREPGRTMAVLRLARAKEAKANARRDHLHKVSRAIVDRYDLIAVEDLKPRSMTRSAKGTVEEPGIQVAAKAGLNRALLDAGLGMLLTLIREKAARAVRQVIAVNPRYTSQTCAACGFRSAENREGEQFACARCGHVDHADINAANVILSRAVQLAPTSELSPASTRLRQHDAA